LIVRKTVLNSQLRKSTRIGFSLRLLHENFSPQLLMEYSHQEGKENVFQPHSILNYFNSATEDNGRDKPTIAIDHAGFQTPFFFLPGRKYKTHFLLPCEGLTEQFFAYLKLGHLIFFNHLLGQSTILNNSCKFLGEILPLNFKSLSY